MPMDIEFDEMMLKLQNEFNIIPKSCEEVYFKYLDIEDDDEYIAVKNEYDFESNKNDIFETGYSKKAGINI